MGARMRGGLGRSVMLLASLWTGTAAAADAIAWREGTVLPNGDAGMMYMASRGGFGAPFGIDITMLALKGDPLLLKAMLAGELDSYIGGPASPLVAASRGADVKIVGCGWNRQTYRLIANASVGTLVDLRGKTLGISSPGSAPDIFMRAALATVGVAPNEVRFVAAGVPSDLINAIATGVLAATATPSEYETRAIGLGLHVVARAEEVTPLAPYRCYFTSGALVAAKPDAVARFLAAEMAAYHWSMAHRDATIALTRAITHAPASAPEPEDGYDQPMRLGVLDTSFEPPMQRLAWLQHTLEAGGQMKPGLDLTKLVDTAPLLRARALFAGVGAAADAGVVAALAHQGVQAQ